MIEIRERLAPKNRVKEEEHLDIRGVKGRDRNENEFARPNGLREKTETGIWCRGSGPARNKKEVYQQSRGGRRCTDAPLWQSNRVELTWSEDKKHTRRNGRC